MHPSGVSGVRNAASSGDLSWLEVAGKYRHPLVLRCPGAVGSPSGKGFQRWLSGLRGIGAPWLAGKAGLREKGPT